MRLLIFFLIILFPAMEVYLLFSWIGEAPLIALSYLLASIIVGFVCIGLAKAGLRDLPEMWRGLQDGGMRYFLLLGRLWFAGALFLFPGYLTDIAAVCVLLFVRSKPVEKKQDDVIEIKAQVLDKE